MRKLILIIIYCSLFVSCNERIVQLPETTNQDITEVTDVSPIYMFYDETKPDSIEFNRNNMISSTNWLVNIDKRLTLKQILPHLQYLQEKRHGDGMHKNENAKNYFSCSNPEIQNLAFIEFTDVIYESKFTHLSSDYLVTNIGSVKFNSFDNIEMGIISENYGGSDNYDYKRFLKEINSLTKSGKLMLKLSFSSKILFQDYIDIKSKLIQIHSDSLQILNHEFIYN